MDPIFKRGQKVVNQYDQVSVVKEIARCRDFLGKVYYKYLTTRFKPVGFLSPARDIEEWYEEGELGGFID